ncbi:MAG: glutamate--tRNA ligase [Planctomycetes bacterium]|nr:glutamate--tRNA ligase [Planctomycetota bacterium]
MPVRTRFAPSPTGYTHIGGMRTALFNWLWARHNGGTFILRIDDTDRQRNIDEALAPILAAFRWLGLDWDEGPEAGGSCEPYFQSQRGPLYQQALDRLLAEGMAFRDFDPPAVTQADREAAEREKRPFLNIRRSLDLSPSDIEAHLAEGRPHVVRFLVPRERTVAIDDVVRGRVEWDCGLIADPVIVRGDGTPLYNFATVVDDVTMHITHVIRAEEHLANVPVQALLFEALGSALPVFAHIPFVAAPGGKKKLSKRETELDKYRRNPQFKGLFEAADRVFPRIGLGNSATLNPVMVEYYEKIGYLPEAVLNALARLGWSLDDKTEILSLETCVKHFTLDRVIKSPAGLDPDKLDSYQLHWMGQRPLEDKVAGCLPFLERAGLAQVHGLQPVGCSEYLARVIAVLGDRLRIFSDILSFDEFFLADDELPYDEKAFDKRLRKPPAAAALLRKFHERLATVEPFDAAGLEAELKAFVDAEGIGLGDVIHAMRIAVTGKPSGPGMFETLELLGRERCLRRIDRALERL